MKRRRSDGIAVVELALLLPVLLLLLAAACVAARAANIKSAAASAAQAEALRSGRRLPGISRRLADTIVPGGRGVTVRSEKGKSALLLPPPFPSLDGRTVGVAQVDKDWREMPSPDSFARLRLARRSELSVDCWDRGTSSARKIRNTVLAVVASAVAR